MNKTIIGRSIKICVKECPLDCALLFIVSGILSVFPGFILCIYNSLIANINTFNTAVIFALCYCFFYAAQKCIYNFYNHYYLNYKSLLHFEKKMKLSFFKVCSKLNLEDYFLPEVVNETRRAQNASINIFRVYQIIIEMLTAMLGVAFIGGIVFSINRSLTVFLVLAVISPIADNVYQIVQKKYLLYKNTQKQKEDDEYIKLLTKPEYLKEIKVLNCFEFIFNNWSKVRQSIIKTEQKVQIKTFAVSLLFHFIRIGGTIGAYWGITGLFLEERINLAEFSMTMLTFSQITQLFNQLFSLFSDLSEFSIMVKPYFSFLDKTKHRNLNKSIPVNEEQGLKLKNISYQYPGAESYALENVSLSLHQGDFISIVGENGSGKTTLTKIILGLISPASGCLKIRLNTDDALQNEELYNEISYIPQAFNCYCISLRDNVLFGEPDQNNSLSQSFEEIGLADLKRRIDDLYGLEFGGIELSGGQKQKLAILRSIMKQAGLFIFDEPTSAIDPLQESVIYRNLLNISRGKTTIMVSHRLALTKQSDLIVVLKDGKIAEMGNHEKLMKKNGEYAEMWNKQSELYLA